MSPMMESMARQCIMQEKRTVPDGEGGFFTAYQDGAPFKCYPDLQSSVQARQAEKLGVTSLYDVLIPKNVPLSVGDIYRDETLGAYFRVTQNPKEKSTPETSTLDLNFFTAEKTELPK